MRARQPEEWCKSTINFNRTAFWVCPSQGRNTCTCTYTNSLLEAACKTRRWEIAQSVCALPTLDLFTQAKSLHPRATVPHAVHCTPTHLPQAPSRAATLMDWTTSAGKQCTRQVSRLLSTPSWIITSSRFGTALISANHSSIPTLSPLP